LFGSTPLRAIALPKEVLDVPLVLWVFPIFFIQRWVVHTGSSQLLLRVPRCS